MKTWTASDNGKVEEIKIALLQLEKEYSISFSEEMQWLDELKYRVQLKQEWSEEDENKITLFMQLTEGCDNYDELQDWNKSLRPQNRWKPSEQ